MKAIAPGDRVRLASGSAWGEVVRVTPMHTRQPRGKAPSPDIVRVRWPDWGVRMVLANALEREVNDGP